MAVSESIVVGVFQDLAQGERAVAELQHAGFTDDQIMFAKHGASSSTTSIFDQLISLFSRRANVKGSVRNDLEDMGVPAADTEFFQREYEAGHSIVMISTSDRRQEAIDILAQFGGYGAKNRWAETMDERGSP